MQEHLGEPSESASFDIVAIAASAGGVQALTLLLGALPADFPVPVVVVQHLDPRHRTVLAEVLDRRTELSVKLAESGEEVHAGIVYVAPPDRHLLIDEAGTVSLTSSALVHFVRPSADLLFESVAGTYGRHAIACVLTGTGRDGAMGTEAVKSRGGTVIVQDPLTADFKGMPEATMATGSVDYALPVDEIATVIRGLVEVQTR